VLYRRKLRISVSGDDIFGSRVVIPERLHLREFGWVLVATDCKSSETEMIPIGNISNAAYVELNDDTNLTENDIYE